MAEKYRVWIDQDLCTGDGICEEIAPNVFTILDDGLAYVRQPGRGSKEASAIVDDDGKRGGVKSLRTLGSDEEEPTIEAAEECPGECIFIEYVS